MWKNWAGLGAVRGRTLAVCLLLAGVGVASAGPLEPFTGNTHPGTPVHNGKEKDKPAIKPAAVEARAGNETIGVTVFFEVYERDGTNVDSPWGRVRSLADKFVPGKASPKQLDTAARYLYLYQICNDSGRPGRVRTASIRLAVPPTLITTWGHFAEKKPKEEKVAPEAVSFGIQLGNEENGEASKVRPVALEPPGSVDDEKFTSVAPPNPAKRPYDLVTMPLQTAVIPAAKAPPGVREPEVVLLRKPSDAPDEEDDYPVALRVEWNEHLLRPGQSSTVFGFTSNYPPEYREVRVNGRPPIEGGAGGAQPPTLTAEGTPPVPHIPEAGGWAGFPIAPYGNMMTGGLGGLPGAGGGSFGGLGGFLPFTGTTNGGAPSGGGGGGSSTPASAASTPTLPSTTTPSNGPTPNAVPEPSSFVLAGALGGAALLCTLLRRRRTRAAA
jgi:hypothetical protein